MERTYVLLGCGFALGMAVGAYLIPEEYEQLVLIIAAVAVVGLLLFMGAK